MTIEKIIEKAEKESNKNLVNLTKTIAYATQETYVKAMNDIYKQVGTGKTDHFTAYKKTVDELMQKGITLTAKDGRNEKLEVAVRRGLFGSLHQTANEIAKKVGENIDYNCVVIGHSSTCRPSHNVIDDVVMSKDEFAKYEYLTEEYGCNHVVNYDWREEFEGINNKKEYGPEHMNDEECKRNYEVQQKARYYERMIREKKNVINRGDTSEKAKQGLKLAQIKYRTYCSNNGLKVDYKRTWKSNFDDNKQNVSLPYKDVTKEWKNQKNNEKGIVSDQFFFVDKNNKKYNVDNKSIILDHTDNELRIATWYAQEKRVNVKMLPRVLYPQKVSSADFIEESSLITWEIKEPEGNTINTTMINQFKGQKEKATHFIVDMHLSEMDDVTAILEIEKIYSSKRYDWVDTVILIRNLKIIKIFKRKK